MKLFEFRNSCRGRCRIYILGKKILSYRKRYSLHDVVKLLNANNGNAFLQDLLDKRKVYDERAIVALAFFYQKELSIINSLLYVKLPEADRGILIRFVLKRFANIDTVTDKESKKLEALFQNAIDLYESRKSIDTPICLDFHGASVQYLTDAPLHPDLSSKKKVLMHVYEVTHAFFLNEYYQPNFLPQDGATILDCGAARGDTAIAFAVQYPHSQIYSFECDSKYFDLLEKNVALNNLSNAHPVKAFLHSATENFVMDGQSVPAISLDDYVEQHRLDNIGLIKLDVEGAEIQVLKGCIKTIRRFKPLLYIPIYHLESDIFTIPQFIDEVGGGTLSFKWTEKCVWGMDGVLFVKFVEEGSL